MLRDWLKMIALKLVESAFADESKKGLDDRIVELARDLERKRRKEEDVKHALGVIQSEIAARGGGAAPTRPTGERPAAAPKTTKK